MRFFLCKVSSVRVCWRDLYSVVQATRAEAKGHGSRHSFHHASGCCSDYSTRGRGYVCGVIVFYLLPVVDRRYGYLLTTYHPCSTWDCLLFFVMKFFENFSRIFRENFEKILRNFEKFEKIFEKILRNLRKVLKSFEKSLEKIIEIFFKNLGLFCIDTFG